MQERIDLKTSAYTGHQKRNKNIHPGSLGNKNLGSIYSSAFQIALTQ
jgi:hypothetical protein